MPLIQNFRYRPEIDGLRAIAVLAVVLYHAGLGVSGGFIGVDVFFVISGFLISSLIIKDLESGKFTLAGFWERRIRRILPAVAVVVLATLVAGWFLLLPDDYASLGKSAVFQALCSANIYFWRIPSGYFAVKVDELPLLHTWSLAVEEQFYMVVPLLLFGSFRMSAFRHRGTLLSFIAAGMAVSLTASICWVVPHPSAAFYSLPSRAWELLCGASVAILPASALLNSRTIRETLTWLALTAIIAPCFLYTKETPFPGLAALPPCLGTALFIWASSYRQQTTDNRQHTTDNIHQTTYTRQHTPDNSSPPPLRPTCRLHRPHLIFPLPLALAAVGVERLLGHRTFICRLPVGHGRIGFAPCHPLMAFCRNPVSETPILPHPQFRLRIWRTHSQRRYIIRGTSKIQLGLPSSFAR